MSANRCRRGRPASEEGVLADQIEAERRAEFLSHMLEILEITLAAPHPAEVTPPEIAERISRAAGEATALAQAAKVFGERYGGLHSEMWSSVEAACPKGVPDDYCIPQGEAAGWDVLERALRDVVEAINPIMPKGLGW